ncbi:MAG: TonB-dependent receptor [Opitutus sp.]|nr:TonB-dependent receptor [Opitutus sp.]
MKLHRPPACAALILTLSIGTVAAAADGEGLFVRSSLAVFGATLGQSTSTGTIEGRVLNADSGDSVESARVTVEGTVLETLTDATGRYRLTNVPAGSAQVRVFRTGVAVQTLAVTVAGGATAQQDFTLTALRRPAAGGATVKLDEFVVASTKEMGNATVAINTQRFAPNQMHVVAADEFGGAAESKVGEVLKSLPGVSMTLGGGGEPFQVSLDGVPSDNVPVTVGGFSLASSGAGTVRSIGLHQIAINTISRIEVVNTPTPESSGASLAGSVNLVPLNAFERAKPFYGFSAIVSMRDDERSLRRTPGPTREPTSKIRPGFEFTGIVPVNKRFGFTVSASASTLYRVQNLSQSTWRGTGAATTGPAANANFPDTTPDKPYLTDYGVRDGGAMVTAASFGATLDFQLSRNDQLNVSLQWAFSDFALTQRVMNFFVGRVAPGSFTPTSTRGFAGAGEIRINNTINGLGGNLYMPSFTYRHNGPLWQSEAGAGVSQSMRWRKDATNGNFFNSVARRQNLTVSYDDIFYLRPNKITVTDAAGAPVDPYKLDGYLLNTASTNAFQTMDRQQTAYANLRRGFFGAVPLTLKSGLDVRRQVRDTRNTNPTLTFVGQDRIANNADDRALAVLDRSYTARTAPYGFPSIEWTSNQALWDLYISNPGYFTENKATSYTQEVALSRHAEETVSAAFVRGDLNLLHGRLKLVGGVRAEQTNVSTEGRLVDPTRNFQRDAAGRVIVTGVNRTPVPITTDALEAARLTNLERALHTEKEYLRWFPSLNAAYNVTDGLVARAGYYWSVGRPDFNQYGGNVSLPNTENPPAPNNQIVLNNAGIKAWTARTTKVALEYYFEPAGLVSVSAFQRDFENLFGSTVIRATPDLLALYGLNPATYSDYDVATQGNIATPVRSTGVSLNYKQALTFLPEWARGVRVFGNVSAQRVTGDVTGSFTGYTPRLANWGVSLSRPKFTAKLNWNYTGKKRLGPVAAGRSIEAETYNWSSKRLVIDLNAEYFLTRRLTVFCALSNIMDDPVDNKIYGPSTPDYAKFRQRQNYGSLWTFGLKGTF